MYRVVSPIAASAAPVVPSDARPRGGAKIAAVDIAPSAALDALRADLEKLGASDSA